MKLINAKTLELEDFTLAEGKPEYAILSHTWGPEELTYEDMSISDRTQKKGWQKIVNTCRLALENDLDYAWVDTCCIDKSSSADLTEAINSMYEWYKNSNICLTQIQEPYDFEPEEDSRHHMKQGRAANFSHWLRQSRWVQRGWTLQELIAPRDVRFYDKYWVLRGYKTLFASEIAEITGVATEVLIGTTVLSSHSVSAKMSWASGRRTTRVEDEAYCLLGLFEVNMPLIYGEGRRAFRRLQEQIVNHTNDLTILCHTSEDSSMGNILAESPRAFRLTGMVVPFGDSFVDTAISNRGLRVSAGPPLRYGAVEHDDESIRTYCLMLGRDSISKIDIGICLRMIGPGIFSRDPRLELAGVGVARWRQQGHLDPMDFHVAASNEDTHVTLFDAYHDLAINMSPNSGFAFTEQIPVPQMLYDMTGNTFLKPQAYHWSNHWMVLAAIYQAPINKRHGWHSINRLHGWNSIVVLCDYIVRSSPPKARVFCTDYYPEIAGVLFRGSRRSGGMAWAELEAQFPVVQTLSNRLEAKTDQGIDTLVVGFSRAPDKESRPSEHGRYMWQIDFDLRQQQIVG